MEKRTCSTARCTNSPAPHRSRSGPGYWCNSCLGWFHRVGTDPTARIGLREFPTECTVDEGGGPCGKPVTVKSAGWCESHRKISSRHGLPTARSRRAKGGLRRLVEEAAHATSDDCIVVTGWRQRPKVRYSGQLRTAARAVWWIATGNDPGEGQVLHTCHQGEQGCINIRHLYRGDHAQNMLDKDEAGHTARGSDHPMAQLNAGQVEQIRGRYTRGTGPYNPGNSRALAAEYGVTQGLIRQIVRRELWSWLA